MGFGKVRFTIEHSQNKGMSALSSILIAGLTFIVAGTSLILDGCSNTSQSDMDTTSNTSKSSNASIDVSSNVNDSSDLDSVSWEEIQDTSYNANDTFKYVKEICNKYGKNVSDAGIQEVAQLAGMLNKFSIVAKSDLKENSDNISQNKDIIINANKVDDYLKNASPEIKKAVKDNNLSDLLLDISSDYKICKSLKLTCASNGVVGDTIKLNVQCSPENADVNYEYVSSDKNVAAVSDDVIKLLAAGDVTITVKDKNTGVSGSAKLAVAAKDANSSTTNKKSEDNGGSSKKIEESVPSIKEIEESSIPSKKPEESSTPSKKPEESSKPVESSKLVESIKPVESSTPSKKPEESSTPSSTPKQEVKATGITLDLSSLSLTSGSTQELNAYILWSNGTSSYQGITWSTSNNGVATVSSSGYVTAKSAGTATITASYGSYFKSCTVTVKAAQSSQPSGGGNGGSSGNGGNGGSGNGGSASKPSDSGNGGIQTQPSTPTITIKYRNDATIEVGKENYVRPSVYKGNEMLAGAAGNYNITYKSSNTSVATVGSDGFVKGISQGTCTITATYGSSTTSCTLTVKATSGSGSGGGSSSTKDEYYYDEFGNRYSTTWVESEHEAFKTKTRKGYTIWECPEMVPIINEYRAKEGKSPLYWYKSEQTKQAFLNNSNLDKIKKWSPEYFNADGSVNWDVYFSEGFGQGCRDNCEYHMDGNPDPHGSNYDDGGAECVAMSTGKYGVRRAVEGWMNSPAHRAYIMKLEGSVYICHNGKFFYLS